MRNVNRYLGCQKLLQVKSVPFKMSSFPWYYYRVLSGLHDEKKVSFYDGLYGVSVVKMWFHVACDLLHKAGCRQIVSHYNPRQYK